MARVKIFREVCAAPVSKEDKGYPDWIEKIDDEILHADESEYKPARRKAFINIAALCLAAVEQMDEQR